LQISIGNLSKISVIQQDPLTNLKKEWNWTEEHQGVFKELKDKITSQQVLSFLKISE